ncbi:hypothetical protein E3N88_17318 [Mikania micrantha]|uniref:Uncharacterized protein n=1 Tax=Mikania micrantha TaxID=192012 RepID=A0A5N6NRI0_9ASTR|nr:hypothetical protein E3N88_17318 [Mikania micrantha]
MVVVRQSEERIPLRTWIRTSAERKSLGAWGRHAEMRVVGDRRSPIAGSEDVGDASDPREKSIGSQCTTREINRIPPYH